MQKMVFVLSLMMAFQVYAYCTPDNNTCFECGSNCVAELTYTKDENNNNVGTFTVYGTSENGAGQMLNYSFSGSEPNRTTTAPWKDKLSDINNVVISEGVTNVGGNTFTGAKNIKHLELATSTDVIQAGAFMDSTLETVNTLKNVSSLEGAAFYHTNLASIDLSDSLEIIKSHAFSYTDIENIVIPDSVKEIYYRAFYGTYNLQNIEIGDGVTKIHENAFDGMPHTTKIYCHNFNERCERLFFGEINTGILQNQLVKYTKEDGYYVYDNQRYRSLQNMQNKIAVKRIYTVKEATDASGKKNSVTIRYK